MTENFITREALLQSFGALATQFSSSLKNAQDLEKKFDASRAKLLQAISSHLKNAQSSLPKENPLQSSLSSFVAAMEKTNHEWNNKVAGRQKGVKFRQGFEDSLLVFVNGKVKSGKSSLGNYMAWGHTDPTDDTKRQTPPERYPRYQSHDKVDVKGGDQDKDAEKKREFRVGATEATSSIQSFQLPGLTWVDSPGLHSINTENGKLAEDYRIHADLILYAMKSDAPGRASDLEEIKALRKDGKRMLLLLTGSDTTKPSVVNGKIIRSIIMKSADDRQAQQNHVRKELHELPNSDNLEIVSLSARYAQEHANDSLAFRDSGMESFFTTLQDICQSEGVKIKQRVPMNNLRNFLLSCENDLQPYQQLMKSFKPELRKIEANLKKQIFIHIREGQNEIKYFIENFFNDLEISRNDAIHINSELKNFSSKLERKFEDIANTRLQAISDELTKDFQSSIKNTYQNSSLTEIPDFKLDTITEQVEAGTRSGTKKRNSGLGALAGGLIGGLLGGPAGAAIGSAIGGGLGSMTGDSASIRYRDVQIIVGDNLHDIRRKMLITHCDAFDSVLKKATDNLWKDFDGSIKMLLKNLSAEIDQFETELQKILNNPNIAL